MDANKRVEEAISNKQISDIRRSSLFIKAGVKKNYNNMRKIVCGSHLIRMESLISRQQIFSYDSKP